MLSVFGRISTDDYDCAPHILKDHLNHLRAEMITLNDCNFIEDCLDFKKTALTPLWLTINVTLSFILTVCHKAAVRYIETSISLR